eukprot:gene1921-biopygen1579
MPTPMPAPLEPLPSAAAEAAPWTDSDAVVAERSGEHETGMGRGGKPVGRGSVWPPAAPLLQAPASGPATSLPPAVLGEGRAKAAGVQPFGWLVPVAGVVSSPANTWEVREHAGARPSSRGVVVSAGELDRASLL